MPKIRFGVFEKKMILKGIILFILLFSVFFMNISNQHIRKKNIKMVKFIKNEKQYKEETQELKKRSLLFEQYLLKINPEEDLDSLKSKYMNMILELLRRYGLKADSYDSQKMEKDGFIIFSYVISAFGNYGEIIRFFLHLKSRVKFMFIKEYKMIKTGSNLIRIDMGIDVLGR